MARATYLDEQSDEQLMAAVAQGNADALRVLYTRHSATMLRLIRRLTSNVSVAEEILQETWVAVWRGADTFRGESSVRGWLLGVCRRQAHNRLRRAEPKVVDLGEAANLPDNDTEVEVRVMTSIGHAEIVQAILNLPDHLREVAILALVEELPYRDVAAVVGIPVGTVKSRMAQVRTRLTRALAENRALS